MLVSDWWRKLPRKVWRTKTLLFTCLVKLRGGGIEILRFLPVESTCAFWIPHDHGEQQENLSPVYRTFMDCTDMAQPPDSACCHATSKMEGFIFGNMNAATICLQDFSMSVEGVQNMSRLNILFWGIKRHRRSVWSAVTKSSTRVGTNSNPSLGSIGKSSSSL